MRILMTVLMVLLLQTAALSVTWHVDDSNTTPPWLGTAADPFQFIQTGINAAVPGDLVKVMPGTYKENINFMGKAITVKSDQGAWLTTIDGSAPINPTNTSVVTFWSGEGSGSILDGFTITQGNGTLINTYQFCGGGIFCDNASMPTIINNTITGNHVNAFGGGIYCQNQSAAKIDHNLIMENISDDDGAGISLWYSDAYVYSNHIGYNITQASAGGIDVWDAQPRIVNNMIYKNQAGNAVMSADGGGIRVVSGAVTITNNTICDNGCTWNGGGLCSVNGMVTATNNIIWGNWALNAGPQIFFYGMGTVNYCDVQGGWPGMGNINANPNFVAPPDFHLQATSPCIDAGDNFAPGVPTDDFEYDPRFFDVPTVPDTGMGLPPMVDMGADEFYVHIWAVSTFSPGASLTLRISGVPGDTPVAFFIGADTWNPPLVWWPYGLWYIKGPMIGPFMMGAIPANGIATLTGTIPNSPPGPFTAYIHGLVGMISTNLCVINIK